MLTVATASLLLFRQQQLADQDPSFRTVLLWQAIIYSVWIPVAAIVWQLFRRRRLTSRTVAAFLVIGAVAIPVHAIGGTFVDIGFSEPGGADLVALAAQRLQLDTLIYSGFGLVAIAAEFHRKAAEEAEAAAAIRAAISRAHDRSIGAGTSQEGSDRLMVSAGSKKVIVQLGDVEWLGSASNYVVVNWLGREGLIRTTLQAFEQGLDPACFVRIHRGTIVNLSKVRSAESLSDGSWRLAMESGAELVASRTHRSEILERLKTS